MCTPICLRARRGSHKGNSTVFCGGSVVRGRRRAALWYLQKLYPVGGRQPSRLAKLVTVRHHVEKERWRGRDSSGDIGRLHKAVPVGKKVYIIEDGDALTPQAQNAMLKILEEPPAYAVFIICVTNAELILPTVRSRSRIIRFAPKSDVQMMQYVQKHIPAYARQGGLYSFVFRRRNGKGGFALYAR